MRIGVDAMGGDHAPREIVRGAAVGLRFLGPQDQLVLYGPQETVAAELAACKVSDARVQIRHCTQNIDMHESPVEALRGKRDSTISRMASDASKNEVDAVISAGNTGAFAAACQLRIGAIQGVSRPGIAVVMPTFHGPCVICDVGANVTPKAHHLYDYARMGTLYSKAILGVKEPRVGIVSIGEEAAKGTDLIKEAHTLIKNDSRLRFVGNMEGKDLFAGQCDVFICDGFVGNVILKLSEGMAEGLFKTIVREIEDESPELAPRFEPIVKSIWRKHDFAEYGGAPLLGLSSVAIICHGRSDNRAIYNAVRVATEQIRVNLIKVIGDQFPQEGAA